MTRLRCEVISECSNCGVLRCLSKSYKRNQGYFQANKDILQKTTARRTKWHAMLQTATRGQTYAVAADVARLFDVEPVDVFLEQAEQWEVEGGESGLLTLECFTFHVSYFMPSLETPPQSIFFRDLTHFGGVAVVKRVLDHQPLEHLDGDVADLSELLEGAAHLPHEEPHQEVVTAEVIGQGVVQLKVCRVGGAGGLVSSRTIK